MRILSYKKQIFLLCMVVGHVSNGSSLQEKAKETLSTLHHLTVPVAQNMRCYAGCTQKVGRQGAIAFQDYFRQQEDKEILQVLRQLGQEQGSSLSETQHQARRALRCLEGCRLSVTVRFLSQFLALIKDEKVVRSVGISLGLISHEWGHSKSAAHVVDQGGEHTKLFAVVFHKGFHRSCLRVLRHEEAETKQFMKNIDILRQVYFEMYGPVPKAREYIS